MVGAILTQNTSWKNVEKAIERLKEKEVLNPKGIRQLRKSTLSSLIRSSGYFRIKAERLKAFIDFLFDEYGGSIKRMKRERVGVLRRKLLDVKGIGPETADSILLYGLINKAIIVWTSLIFWIPASAGMTIKYVLWSSLRRKPESSDGESRGIPSSIQLWAP
jgi:endonuclease-3 related protein